MKMKVIPAVCLASAILFAYQVCAYPQDIKPIKLPAPQAQGGKPLMQALKDRKTDRAFSVKELPQQMLSDMLWAADGINRSDSGRRTAPSL
jgi:hypothetical protein